jgi:hypothetical protein
MNQNSSTNTILHISISTYQEGLHKHYYYKKCISASYVFGPLALLPDSGCYFEVNFVMTNIQVLVIYATHHKTIMFETEK